MERRYGVDGSTLDGVFFTEATIAGVRPLRHVAIEISKQNSNLVEVKRCLALEARAVGASAVMNFRYGQRAHPWWELIFTFKWDTESWHGEGDAVNAGS